jgi:hypothetical protein
LVPTHFLNVDQSLKENGGNFGTKNISPNKTINMIYICFLFVVLWIWISYEIWRAPMMEETADGDLIIKKPAKKLCNLWQKEN